MDRLLGQKSRASSLRTAEMPANLLRPGQMRCEMP